MSNFSTRSVACYDLPLSIDTPVLRPEQAILRFPHGKTIDIGAVCYLQREKVPEHRHNIRKATEGRKVLLSSLCPKRVNNIRRFIKHISDELLLGKRRATTIHTNVGIFSLFMTWADENGHSDVLDDELKVRAAARAYAAHLWRRVATHEISQNTGATQQNVIYSLLGEFLGLDRLSQGINVLRKNSNSVEATEPPSEADQSRVLRICEALFNGLTTLVLDEKPYPFGVIMPAYLGYPKNTMWIFPVLTWCRPVAKLGEVKDFSGKVFDYSTGCLRTRNEIEALNESSQDHARTTGSMEEITLALTKAKQLINNANATHHHYHRRYMGMMALNSFIPLFLSRTGMNWEQLVGLRWSGDYFEAVSTIRQKFREVKHRAGDRKVTYQLPLKFMRFFKRFLQLRSFLLQDYPQFDGLFFTLGPNRVFAPDYLKTSLAITYGFLRRIDPGLALLMSRKWRAAKSDWFITRTDISTTALILQNSESTVMKSYAAGAVETHLTELTTFLDRMVVDKGIALGGSISAVGKCESYGKPHEVPGISDVPVKPDCERPEVGCLFCDKFKVHADEVDVRKLLSCRYCLTRTSHLAGFHAMSEPLIRQINLILSAVNRRDDLLVARIAAEVDEGELDPYWANKYDMLLRLRLVNDNE